MFTRLESKQVFLVYLFSTAMLQGRQTDCRGGGGGGPPPPGGGGGAGGEGMFEKTLAYLKLCDGSSVQKREHRGCFPQRS